MLHHEECMSFLEEGYQGQRDVVCGEKVSDHSCELCCVDTSVAMVALKVYGWKSKEEPEAKDLTCLFLDGLCVTPDKEL